MHRLLIAAICLSAAPAAEIVSDTTVYVHTKSNPQDTANRHGFNHAPSIVRMPDGSLMAAWFSGPFEGSARQSILHSVSRDDGVTWSKAAILQDFPKKSDFDPAFVAAGKRTFLFFSAGLRRLKPFEGVTSAEVGDQWMRLYMRFTDDSGRTWSEPRIAYDTPAHTSRTNGIRLLSGELLEPIHKLGTKGAGVLKSTDAGVTWKRYGEIENPAGEGGEPTIVELRSGRVMMFIRTGDGFLWRSFSSDKGETWSKPDNTGMAAAQCSHNLFRMTDGRLVLTHNPSKPPLRTPLTLRVSTDDGQTWGEPLTLASVTPPPAGDRVRSRQVVYPSVAQIADKMLVVVWAKLSLADDEMMGDIHATLVRVP